MDKTTLLAELKKQRLVAVIRGKDEEEVTNIVDAVYRGGIHFMEITYTTGRTGDCAFMQGI